MNDSVVFSFMKLIENYFSFSVGLFVCDHVLTLTHTHMKMKIGKKPLRPSQTKKRKLLLYTSFRKLFCFFYICGRYCIVPVIKFISMVSIQCGKGYKTRTNTKVLVLFLGSIFFFVQIVCIHSLLSLLLEVFVAVVVFVIINFVFAVTIIIMTTNMIRIEQVIVIVVHLVRSTTTTRTTTKIALTQNIIVNNLTTNTN